MALTGGTLVSFVREEVRGWADPQIINIIGRLGNDLLPDHDKDSLSGGNSCRRVVGRGTKRFADAKLNITTGPVGRSIARRHRCQNRCFAGSPG